MLQQFLFDRQLELEWGVIVFVQNTSYNSTTNVQNSTAMLVLTRIAKWGKIEN